MIFYKRDNTIELKVTLPLALFYERARFVNSDFLSLEFNLSTFHSPFTTGGLPHERVPFSRIIAVFSNVTPKPTLSHYVLFTLVTVLLRLWITFRGRLYTKMNSSSAYAEKLGIPLISPHMLFSCLSKRSFIMVHINGSSMDHCKQPLTTSLKTTSFLLTTQAGLWEKYLVQSLISKQLTFPVWHV